MAFRAVAGLGGRIWGFSKRGHTPLCYLIRLDIPHVLLPRRSGRRRNQRCWCSRNTRTGGLSWANVLTKRKDSHPGSLSSRPRSYGYHMDGQITINRNNMGNYERRLGHVLYNIDTRTENKCITVYGYGGSRPPYRSCKREGHAQVTILTDGPSNVGIYWQRNLYFCTWSFVAHRTPAERDVPAVHALHPGNPPAILFHQLHGLAMPRSGSAPPTGQTARRCCTPRQGLAATNNNVRALGAKAWLQIPDHGWKGLRGGVQTPHPTSTAPPKSVVGALINHARRGFCCTSQPAWQMRSGRSLNGPPHQALHPTRPTCNDGSKVGLVNDEPAKRGNSKLRTLYASEGHDPPALSWPIECYGEPFVARRRFKAKTLWKWSCCT